MQIGANGGATPYRENIDALFLSTDDGNAVNNAEKSSLKNLGNATDLTRLPNATKLPGHESGNEEALLAQTFTIEQFRESQPAYSAKPVGSVKDMIGLLGERAERYEILNNPGKSYDAFLYGRESLAVENKEGTRRVVFTPYGNDELTSVRVTRQILVSPGNDLSEQAWQHDNFPNLHPNSTAPDKCSKGQACLSP